jgi:hypothetical protein
MTIFRSATALSGDAEHVIAAFARLSGAGHNELQA